MWIIKIIKIKCFFSSTDTKQTLIVYKFRPERIGFNMYAEYTRPQITFLDFNAVICLIFTHIMPHDMIHLEWNISVNFPRCNKRSDPGGQIPKNETHKPCCRVFVENLFPTLQHLPSLLRIKRLKISLPSTYNQFSC